MPRRRLISLTCPHAGHTHLCVWALLLSLHDESRQRRAKEREENRSGGFLPSLWNLSHLSTDRASPPHGKRAVSYVFNGVKVVRAQLTRLKFEPPTSRGLPNAIDAVRFPQYTRINACIRGQPIRGLASGRCPPRLYLRASPTATRRE